MHVDLTQIFLVVCLQLVSNLAHLLADAREKPLLLGAYLSLEIEVFPLLIDVGSLHNDYICLNKKI